MKVRDLTGQQFSRLTVLERASNSKQQKARWICVCACGSRVTITSRNLIEGKTNSCGCLRNEMNVHDLAGQQFGRLRVSERANSDRHKKARWSCTCECGNRTIVGSRNLLTGLTRSCGCLRKEMASKAMATHRMTGTSEYRSYLAAKSRCENPNQTHFAHYGGRGIKFLYTSFEQFFADVGHRPPGTSIERCDNDGHYEPGNCRWTTRIEQGNNKRNNRKLTAFGRTRTLRRWAREYGIHHGTLLDRIKKGWNIEKALTTPSLQGRAIGPLGVVLDQIAEETAQ